MAKIVMGSYMFRYPMGGMLSWVLQYLIGLKDLGHDVFFVEKYGYPDSCYDPVKGIMSNDCTYGVKVVRALLKRFGFDEQWCFVAEGNHYYGLSKKEIEDVFRTADVFIDMGTHGSWNEEASTAQLRVLIDGEPGFTQIKWAKLLEKGTPIPVYDRYFTNGWNVGTASNSIPTLNLKWEKLFNPVHTKLILPCLPVTQGSFTTIMNWSSHAPIEYKGVVYGQKDVEFEKFYPLPNLTKVPLEISVSGIIPTDRLYKNGWQIKSAVETCKSFDTYINYISESRGEFSVCKNVFVANRNGWFSDRSAMYLAMGKPVVVQDTGFSRFLPVGEGVFAVNTVEEACASINEIEGNYATHAKKAREIACEFMDAPKVMEAFLKTLGV